jgi:protocatechuate 3,4-dioxygenase beta subunit
MLQQKSRFTLAKAGIGLLITALPFSVQAIDVNSKTSTSGTNKKTKLVDLWQPGDSGERMNIRGRVTSLDGTPLAGIAIEIRQADGDGHWTEQYRTTLTTDARGRYQFGSVVPVSNYCGDPHVEVVVYQNGWEYFDDKIVFEDSTSVDSIYYGDGTSVFLEESDVKGETIKYGRFDIVLSPE